MKATFILTKIGSGFVFMFLVSFLTYSVLIRDIIFDTFTHDLGTTLSIIFMVVFYSIVTLMVFIFGKNLSMSWKKFCVKYKEDIKKQISFYEKEIERLNLELNENK